MYTKEDLLARLQNGEDLSTIADELANALNEAQKEFDEITKREAKEKAEAERVAAAKEEAALMMLDALSDYLIASGEEELQAELVDCETSKLIEMLDGAIEMTKSLKKLQMVEFEAPAVWDMGILNKFFGC